MIVKGLKTLNRIGMARKKSKTQDQFDWNTLELETANIPRCDHFGCDQEGTYPAPKSLQNPQDRYYFCLEHVKAYNQQWDYMAEIKKAGPGYDPHETDGDAAHNPYKSAFSKKAAHAFKSGQSRFYTRGIKDPHDILGDDGMDADEFDPSFSRHGSQNTSSPGFTPPKYFSPKTPEGRAFKTLGLKWPFTEDDLKSAYKNLAKQHHPDLNQQSSDSLEKFREIKDAYELLKNLLDAVYGR